MKKTISVILILTMVFSFFGCRKNNQSRNDVIGYDSSYTKTDKDNGTPDEVLENNETASANNTTQGTDENGTASNSDDYVSNNVKTQEVKIGSLDQLNFYAVKKAIAQNDISFLSAPVQKPKLVTLADKGKYNLFNLANSTTTNINPNADFTITMYSYFTITINDTRGFLAQKLGGTGSVEVVITRNNFNNMITFKKGERYYSCLQTSLTERAMSFSTHKYVSGFQLVENFDQENYEYTVYFEGDKVVGMNCGRFEGNGNFEYVADDIKFNDSFCFVIHKKQTFTAEQLEGMFKLNNSFVDDGVVLNDGTVLFGESSVTDNLFSMKDKAGVSVIDNSLIKKVTAMYNDKFGFCIRLELLSDNSVSDKMNLDFYINNLKDRELTVQKDGAAVYITDLNNKSRMSDVFYKLTANNTSNRIGRIIDRDDFVTEASKRLNLSDYNMFEEDYSESDSDSLKVINYTYELKTNKSISHKMSNYDITIDGVTITMPIKVSDLLEEGFTLQAENFIPNMLQGGATFVSPDGNKFDAFVMNFYGNSRNLYDCYVTHVGIACHNHCDKCQEGISSTRPDFEMIEGINKDSTLDDIISRLGEPNKITLLTIENQQLNYEARRIQLFYNVTTPSLPNGELVFDIHPVLNNTAPTDFLRGISFTLQ